MQSALEQYQMYINGVWTNGESQQVINVENPANEQVIAQVPAGTVADAQLALSSAKQAQKAWAALTFAKRAQYISNLAREVEQNSAHLAQIVVKEQGKPLVQAQGEIGAVVSFLDFAVSQSKKSLGDVIPADNDNEEIFIRRLPYGVVVALTAWNYPAALVARKLAPALIAGNTIVIKAHECTPLSGIEIVKLCEKVGIPAGVVNLVTGNGIEVGDALVRSENSDLVTMTGSNRAGREIFKASAEQVKTLRLELGGKAPFIVMEDADIEAAVEAAISARFTNCGQICTCNERMYLHTEIADQFMQLLLAKVKKLSVGDPMSNPDIGPKVNLEDLLKVERMVDQAVAQGAQVLAGGKRLTDGKYSSGFWFEPTILSVKSNDLTIMQEEVFGPVLPVLIVDSYEQAVEYANDTRYGLSAYVFTQNLARIMNIKNQLQFGEVYINRGGGESVQGFHNGWKHSGIGGEDGEYGFDNYLRKQTSYLSW